MSLPDSKQPGEDLTTGDAKCNGILCIDSLEPEILRFAQDNRKSERPKISGVTTLDCAGSP